MNGSPAAASASTRLSDATLARVPAAVLRPDYERQRAAIGIVHLGAGAFHRAHQAAYVDALLAREPGWAISAVSLHSTDVRDALRPQDGLYTLALLGEQPGLRVIGAIREVLSARDEREAVLQRLADAAVRLVTLTITEKGYCLAGEELDLSHPEIVRDLATPQAPTGALGTLVEGLRRRWRRGLAPLTVLSCDNLPANGAKLRRAVLQYAQRTDPALMRFIEREIAFPGSMVDSITPATDEALRARVARELGVADAWPVQREPFTQWVIEDRFCHGRPAFEQVGVILSDDVAGYDRAKLRLLNGPHSSLAYLGSLLGLSTVAEAMSHTLLAGFVERLMRDAIIPNLAAPRSFDASAYASAILQRFRNPAIQHRLSQIAWDGSQKLPVRLLGTIALALGNGRSIATLCLPIAAWLHFIRRQARAGATLTDPLADTLLALGRAASGDAWADVGAFLSLDAVFAPLSSDARFTAALRTAYAALGDGSPGAVTRALDDVLRARETR